MATAYKKDLSQLEKEELQVLLMDVQSELQQKKSALRETRGRLLHARKKIKTLKETVDFQRKRIVDLYRNQSDTTK